MFSLIPTLLIVLAPFGPALHSPGDTRLSEPAGVYGEDSQQDPAPLTAACEGRHGKIDWFKGSYKELMAKAIKEDKVIFLNFYTDWCTRCKELDREAYSDPRTLEALEDVLCFSIDAESDEGVQLNAQYPTKNLFPALIFLDPDGALRDRICGYKPTEKFLPELSRILDDRETLADFRRRAEANPKDIDVIWDFATKLQDLGDTHGYNEQLKTIRRLDPKEQSLTLRRLLLIGLMERPTIDPESIRKFLKKEAYPELLFDGWHYVAWQEKILAKRAARNDDRKLSRAHMDSYHLAHRKAWPHCPTSIRHREGNHIAWELYLDWGAIDDELRSFSIEVARDTVKYSKGKSNEAEVLDTLACCLFSQGDTIEAIALIRKCIQLEPENPLWSERLEMFLAKEI
jgi:thioredoxin-related protein